MKRVFVAHSLIRRHENQARIRVSLSGHVIKRRVTFEKWKLFNRFVEQKKCLKEINGCKWSRKLESSKNVS